jgi:hypothetical protein
VNDSFWRDVLTRIIDDPDLLDWEKQLLIDLTVLGPAYVTYAGIVEVLEQNFPDVTPERVRDTLTRHAVRAHLADVLVARLDMRALMVAEDGVGS